MQKLEIEEDLRRWLDACVIDDGAAERIRAFELAETKPAGMRWQVTLALVFGSMLMAAGVVLFVAAHWDQLSPMQRLALVASKVVLLHAGAILARGRFEKLATALHGIGTIAAGAAIALVGQIFNMQEHWPAAILLWALCAMAGWWLLRDGVQETLALLLLPAWAVCEWADRAEQFNGSIVYGARMLLVLGGMYLAASLWPERKRLVKGVLLGFAAPLIAVSVVVLSEGWAWVGYHHYYGFVPLSLRVASWLVIVVFIAFGAWKSKAVVPVALVLVVLGEALPFALRHLIDRWNGGTYDRAEPNIASYALVAAASAFLAWWGVRQLSRALINFGMVAFAASVLWFYSSSVMGKLSRSIGLMGLGVLFLAGGWALEKMRRRLVAQALEVRE